MWQLLKPTHLRICASQQEKLPQWEAHASQLENNHSLPQLEKGLVQWWRPSIATINKSRHSACELKLPAPTMVLRQFLETNYTYIPPHNHNIYVHVYEHILTHIHLYIHLFTASLHFSCIVQVITSLIWK